MSEKTVAERLQLKGTRRLALIAAPPDLDHAIGAPNARTDPAHADILLLAASNRAALETTLPTLLQSANPAAILWIAYYKLTSPHASDLNRDNHRTLAPTHCLDTVSQIAIDENWFALRMKRI